MALREFVWVLTRLTARVGRCSERGRFPDKLGQVRVKGFLDPLCAVLVSHVDTGLKNAGQLRRDLGSSGYLVSLNNHANEIC
jgi:hypothetical protein